MADFTYNIYKFQTMGGDIDLSTGGDDIRVMLLEAASDEDKDDVTITEVLAHGGTTELATYTRGALADEATSQDDTDDEGVFDATDIVFSSVVSQNAIVACVIFKFVTNDGDSLPLIFIDSGFPVTPNGSDITITWAAEGILNLNDV